VIPYDWNKFVKHVKSVKLSYHKMGVFEGDDHKYVVNLHFDKPSFSNGR
jgi:hypothetical protein